MKKNVLFILLIALFGCSESYRSTVDSSGSRIITGICDRNVFVSQPDFREWYMPQYSGYQVDRTDLAEIDSLSQNVSFLVFFGTWCGDSKREVPRFLKLTDEAKIPSKDIVLYGVDRSKRSDDGMTDQHHVLNVPTILVMDGGKEVGRIVESPEETLAKDLIRILKKR